MKYYLLFSFVIVSALLCKAQDTIVKRNGEKLVIKLVEVNENDVKYRWLNYVEGPLFTLGKQDIDYISYSNGVKESYANFVAPVPKPNFVIQDITIQPSGKYFYYKERKISERDMLAIVENQREPKLNLMIKSVEKDRFIQNITTAASIVCGVTGLYLYVKNQPPRGRRGSTPTQSTAQVQGQKNGKYLMLAGIGCELASVYFIFDRRKNDRILVRAYNRMITIH